MGLVMRIGRVFALTIVMLAALKLVISQSLTSYVFVVLYCFAQTLSFAWCRDNATVVGDSRHITVGCQ